MPSVKSIPKPFGRYVQSGVIIGHQYSKYGGTTFLQKVVGYEMAATPF